MHIDGKNLVLTYHLPVVFLTNFLSFLNVLHLKNATELLTNRVNLGVAKDRVLSWITHLSDSIFRPLMTVR
jgi:hypothetical protein